MATCQAHGLKEAVDQLTNEKEEGCIWVGPEEWMSDGLEDLDRRMEKQVDRRADGSVEEQVGKGEWRDG